MIPIEYIITAVACALILSVAGSKVSARFGVPALILFLFIGMMAGSEGPGGIYFDNVRVAQGLGVVALSFILFAGGLSTDFQSIKPVLVPGLLLSSLGVFITSFIVGFFAKFFLYFNWLEGLLLGSIVASTDAAAIFAVLRSKKVSMKGRLTPLLEFESGSNDPMAVFFTITLITLITHASKSILELIPLLFFQIILGLGFGIGFSKLFIRLMNRLRLEYEGLYPVFMISIVLFIYGVTTSLKGSGFLAVYCAGLVMGNTNFVHKKSLVRFQDGLAWLMQISMFLVLGLLVFPKQLLPVATRGFLVSMVLIFVARPVSVFASLAFSNFTVREKLLVSWVGLRGAVPIVLATFPLLAGIPQASFMFNMVFFIVITSALLQGTTIPPLTRFLRLDGPLAPKRFFPIDFEYTENSNMQLIELIVPYESAAVGKAILTLDLPKESLIALICRAEQFLMPRGDSILEAGDVLLILVSDATLPKIRESILKKAD